MKPLRKKLRPTHNISKDTKVYMPLKKSSIKPLRKPKRQLFKPHVATKTRKNIKIPSFSIYILLIVAFLGISYAAIMYINNLRNTEKKHVEVQVIGLENIPAYPGSTFIFENSQNQDSVKNFLSGGNSGYRLPSDSNIADVFEYYKDKLPSQGWTFVQMVPMESEEKEYGQYWTNDTKGLRIYSKYNDVWYESITITQAQNGLSDRVALEAEREVLLAESEAQDLLPDFPWILKAPNEYLLSYKVSSYNNNLQQLLMSKIGSEEKVYLVPIGKVGTKALDYFVNDYVAQLNAAGKDKWSVLNTVVIATNQGSGLKGTIGNGANTDEIVVLQNSYNNVVYIIDSNVLENPFVDYILKNISPQSTKKY